MKESHITLRSFVLGVIFSALFAALTVYFSNIKQLYVSSTQIPVLPYVLLFVAVLFVNPICRLIRIIRPFSAAEILIVFIMGFVSAGISTFGLCAQVVPVMGNLFNKHWNNDQTEWNRHIVPFVNEQYFVAEPGIQKAALAYREAVNQARKTKGIYDSALDLLKAKEMLKAGETALRAAESSEEDEAGRASGPRVHKDPMGPEDRSAGAGKAFAISRAEMMIRGTRESYQEALARWELKTAKDENLTTMPIEEVVEQYPSLIEGHEALAQERREALRELEIQAFEKVDQYRRGLPPELRAFPGLFPTGDDTFDSYTARLRRFRYGMKALRDLTSAYKAEADSSARFKTSLEEAISSLKIIGDTKGLESRKETLNYQLENIRNELSRCENSLTDLHEKSRFADPRGKKALEKQIDKLNIEKQKLQNVQEEIADHLEKTGKQEEVTRRVASVIGEVSHLRQDLDASPPVSSRMAKQRLAGVMRRFPSFDASLRRYFLGDIPWSVWIPPLLRWGILIALTYVALMAFNLLIFRQWAHNEKLIFPLAQLTEDLAGADSQKDGAIPAVFRSALFWVGAGISGGVLGWNLLCATQAIPGLQEINLANYWRDFIQNSPLQGLVPWTRSAIFFTMIGISFLIPQKISFSLWFFSVLYMIQLLVLVRLGHGTNEQMFPIDWCYTMNFRTAEGAGALLVFSLVVLYKCRKYIMCFFFPLSISDLDGPEQKELRVSSFLFIFGSLAIILILWLGMKAHLGHAVFFYVAILLITIGLIRAVAEGGILGFQAYSGPFHLIRSIFGMDKSWTAPSLFSPLMVYYAVFFFDLKTFIAPAMANAIKIRDDLKMKRGRFHLAIFAAIAIAVVVAAGAEIMLSYSRGADNMNGWFHTSFPKMLFDQMASMAKTPPEVSRSGQLWVVTGAVLMAALLYFRQTCFWLPHPLGFIMLVNPIMGVYWFSILIGWIAKSLVTKYGNKDTYAKMRCLFIGLIAGELILVVLAMIFSIMLDANIGIDLNRNYD